ncbi:unnamed protein product [Durusdinium trenchii]|uniref:Uncharacterized protein n=1 Tax=Durusdinium trenchii TaxID=1381693 RepID=A0ABP0MWT6_9DINO
MASKAGLGTKSIIILGASAVDRSDPSPQQLLQLEEEIFQHQHSGCLHAPRLP